MKINGQSPIVTNGASLALVAAIVVPAFICIAAKRKLAHLTLWAGREQSVRR